MSDKWYCSRAGEVSGPYALAELQFLLARGKLTQLDLVRRGTSGSWIPLAELASQTVKASAPSPPPTGHSPPLPRVEGRVPAMEAVSNQPTMLHAADRDRMTKRRLVVASAAVGLLCVLAMALWLAASAKQVAERSPSKSQEPASVVAPRTNQKPTPPTSVSSEPKPDSPLPGDASPQPLPASPAVNDKPAPGAAASARDSGATAGTPTPAKQPVAPVRTNEEPAEQPPSEGLLILPIGITDDPMPGVPGKRIAPLYQGRSADARKKLAIAGGGSVKTEAAVEAALKWLANHQHPEGKWTLDKFCEAGDCQRKCDAPGRTADVAATGLAILPFLGAGETHRTGKYVRQVRSGLNWLIEDQQPDGSFKSAGSGTMYGHGIAALALCEAAALTFDPPVLHAAKRAVGFIVESQDPRGGGWRYDPRQTGDLSVTGWQIMALRSARAAEIEIPELTTNGAKAFLQSVQVDPSGGQYAYQPHSGTAPRITSVGLLSHAYLHSNAELAPLHAGAPYLLQNLPDPARPDFYYWYYGTLVMHQLSGEPWNTWNERMRKVLVDSQESQGHQQGSWRPGGGHDSSGGRLYATALGACTLEVYYRYMPLYRTGGK